MDLDFVFATATDETAAARGILESYVSMSLRHPEIVGLLLTEGRHLPDEQQATLHQAQREYLTEWTALVAKSLGDGAASQSRTRVAATVRLVNDLVRTAHLGHDFDLDPSIVELASRLLEPTAGLANDQE